MSTVAVVTGATRNLGLELVRGLAERLAADDVVYLTGQAPGRVSQALELVGATQAEVRGASVDVAEPEAIHRFASSLAGQHGGVDLIFANHYARTQPDDDPAEVIDRYVAVNNLGTTAMLRAFAPILRDGARLFVVASRAGSLRTLAPVLHDRFDADLGSLDDVDRAVCTWRDAVREGRAAGQAWPAWINIPSKIGQVAAVRTIARQRREDDVRRGIFIAAVCPGLIDTGASRRWLDMARAQTPAAAAARLLDFALAPVLDSVLYGELVLDGQVVPWKP
jgi:NAD(P)-dependent dehydrogenase (short-subunit alcohol dehydrogenase family)